MLAKWDFVVVTSRCVSDSGDVFGMSPFQVLENKVTSLEGLVTIQEWDAVIPAIQEFCALEEELTRQLKFEELTWQEKDLMKILIQRFSCLIEAVSAQRAEVAVRLDEISSRHRQVSRIQRAYGG